MKIRYETPPKTMDMIRKQWGPFDLDPCCEKRTAKAPRFFTKADDGLKRHWFGRVFMNPPYGEQNLRAWMKKAWEESRRDAVTVVCLVPAQTGSVWFHEWAMRGEIHFLKGKVYFLLDGEKIGAPILHSLVVEFSGRNGRLTKI